MRVLITGINGFVAGHLADLLLARAGSELWGQSRRPELAHPQLRGGVRLRQADLLDADSIARLLDECRPELVVHLAAQAFVPESFADPAGTLTANVVAAANLFQALLRQGLDPTVLSIGSYEEYGAILPEELPIDEGTPLRPVNPYGVSKAALGLLAQQFGRSHGLRAIHMRPFNHIGPRQSARVAATSFARQIARIEAGLQPPLLRVGNMSAERDFSDVRDVVAAYLLAAEHGSPGSIYNVGSGEATSIQLLLDTLLELSGTPVELQVDQELLRPVDTPRVICDASRLRADTGWAPRFSLRATLADLLDDWRARVRAEP
jgi:GDP-4-dehydro-6-deoxy-D-mannose reductase